jgi:N-acyl-D-amino-acid deacylase
MLPIACALLPVTASQADFVNWRTTIPVTPLRPWPGGRPFDLQVTSFMAARNIPGGALAISRAGKLVYACGYGYADVDAQEALTAASPFRIASVSKPITAVAVFRLIELHPGQVSLETPAFELLGLTGTDPRLAQITIRQLLQHTAGWDRDKSFDPMFRPLEIAQTLGTPPPAGPDDVVRYMLDQPLDFDPGSRDAYSNFGYCVLGRIIEKVSGQPYEAFVQEAVLRPLGISRMTIGRTRLADRAAGEVRYYDPGSGPSVMQSEDGVVPSPYGTFHLEAMDAHGGWIASAVDLVRFACAFDEPERCPLLTPESVAAMFACPEGSAGHEPDGRPKDAYYACGWMVRPTGDGKANHWHGGSLPGTNTLLVRRHDGLNWAVLFSQRADESGLGYGDIDPGLHRAAGAVEQWPEWDLFAGP